MGKYDFEEELSGSDGDDDFLHDEIRALSMACMPLQPPPSAADGGATADNDEFSDDNDDDDDDDFELVRSIKEQYGCGDDISQPLSLKPIMSLPPALSDDDEDDFETLRAIQKRFSRYCGAGAGGGDAAGDDDAMASKDDDSVDKSFHKSDAVGTSLGSEFLDVHQRDFGQDTWDAAENFQNVETSSCTSSFPMSAQTFMEAIKKNRSSQKFIRSKMLHIEARMEEINDIKKRLKTLRDFQVQCKKKIGRALSQKQDARVQLISALKQRANTKGSEKNISAMLYGPLENSHVVLYKAAMENFPLSFHREKWSKDEKQLLNKEISNQFQKSLFNKSADAISAIEESGFDNGVDGMISSIKKLEITPEIIQDFVGKVDWNQLASMFPRRSREECEARWLNNENCVINRDNWTSDEDKHLLLLVQKNGIHNWSYIAEKLETNRTPFQCLARYQRSLNASILKRDWTEDEDAQLRCAVESFGESNWQAVASVLEGRTGTQCSNRWNKTLLPARQRVGTWSISEDKRLKVAVTLFGHKSWHRIASFVPGRTQAQCRERWVNVLDPSLNRGQWTEEDDMRLIKAIQEHGYCWSKVAACVPLRTDNQCRRRWMRLFPNDVLRLKAAKDIEKAALISNFVDRESERPTLGANDFVPLRITDSTNRQEIENVTQEQNKSRKSRKADQTSVSCRGPKGVRSRKCKKGDRLTTYNDDDARRTNGKRRAIRSGSKERRKTRNCSLAAEPNKSREIPELHDNSESETLNIPIRIRSRRLRGVRSKEVPLISHCGGSQATGIHDTEMNVATLVHSSSQDNDPEMLDGQSSLSDLLLRIREEKVEMSNIVAKTKKRRFSKLQPRRSSLAKTNLGDNNCEAMELRTFDDGNETLPKDVACSSKENAVTKQKKRKLLLDQSVGWEDLPLAVLFRRNVTRIQRRISS
ncbi:uncharacterized protein LOC110709474 [Chenopodium quinoa]|uniref:uncharacterized protein LOC110709474 n=1 Tax=Chenopodium quinoa TaxID=63459 RepID=UPI000B78CF97|nr:uncharacterized protein LOC110709474 [Chenopodium quinoa]XP_021743389.1 uncharacterized protein LOC110709474 [Chenopodium quinoa]